MTKPEFNVYKVAPLGSDNYYVDGVYTLAYSKGIRSIKHIYKIALTSTYFSHNVNSYNRWELLTALDECVTSLNGAENIVFQVHIGEDVGSLEYATEKMTVDVISSHLGFVELTERMRNVETSRLTYYKGVHSKELSRHRKRQLGRVKREMLELKRNLLSTEFIHSVSSDILIRGPIYLATKRILEELTDFVKNGKTTPSSMWSHVEILEKHCCLTQKFKDIILDISVQPVGTLDISLNEYLAMIDGVLTQIEITVLYLYNAYTHMKYLMNIDCVVRHKRDVVERAIKMLSKIPEVTSILVFGQALDLSNKGLTDVHMYVSGESFKASLNIIENLAKDNIHMCTDLELSDQRRNHIIDDGVQVYSKSMNDQRGARALKITPTTHMFG